MSDPTGLNIGDIKSFIRACMLPGIRCRTSHTYDAFIAWHRATLPKQLPEPTRREFAVLMTAAGLERVKFGVNCWKGVALVRPDQLERAANERRLAADAEQGAGAADL